MVAHVAEARHTLEALARAKQQLAEAGKAFTDIEVGAMVGAAWITSYLVHEGRTNWFEGLKLLGAYALVVLMFLFA